MIISIASGEGGTGKTTVATNMALSLGSAVQLLDCDVEEPNAHLFIHPVFEYNTKSKAGQEINKIWERLCANIESSAR
jgi:MinD superfamily P-loop ATPase